MSIFLSEEGRIVWFANKYYKDIIPDQSAFFYHHIFDNLIYEIGSVYKFEIKGKNGLRHKGIKKIRKVAYEKFGVDITNVEVKSLRMAICKQKGWCTRVPYSMHIIFQSILYIISKNETLKEYIRSRFNNKTNYWSEFLVPNHDFAIQFGKRLLKRRIEAKFPYSIKEHKRFTELEKNLNELEINNFDGV